MDIGPLITGGAIAVLAGVVGYGARLFETKRTERRITYVAYLRAVDAVPQLVYKFARQPDKSGELMDAVMHRAWESHHELILVASRRVLRRSEALLEEIEKALASFRSEIHTFPDAAVAANQFRETYTQAARTAKAELVDAMRRDLWIRKVD